VGIKRYFFEQARASTKDREADKPHLLLSDCFIERPQLSHPTRSFLELAPHNVDRNANKACGNTMRVESVSPRKIFAPSVLTRL
jgi:hypothetical protein